MDDLHAALKELFEARKTHESGDKYTFPLEQAKKKLEQALEQIIDARIAVNNRRSQRRPASSYIALQKPPDTNDERAIAMLDALNSCPAPPDNMKWFIGETMLSWMRAYTDWYNDKRNRALNKG